MLGVTNLHDDPILIRKIKRIQAAQNAEDDDSEEERRRLRRGSQRRQPEEIGDDSSQATNSTARFRSVAPRVKAEKLASSLRQQSVVPDTQPSRSSGDVDPRDPDAVDEDHEGMDGVVDLEDPDGDDE